MSQFGTGFIFDPSESWARGFGMAMQKRQLDQQAAAQQAAAQQRAHDHAVDQQRWEAGQMLAREQMAERARLAGIDDARMQGAHDLQLQEFQFRQSQAADALARQAQADGLRNQQQQAWGQFITGAGLPEGVRPDLLAQMDPVTGRQLAGPALAEMRRRERLQKQLDSIETEYNDNVANVHGFFNDLAFGGKITPEQYEMNVSRNLQSHREWRNRAVQQAEREHELDASPVVPFDVPSALDLNGGAGAEGLARQRMELAQGQEGRRKITQAMQLLRAQQQSELDLMRAELSGLQDPDARAEIVKRYREILAPIAERLRRLEGGDASAAEEPAPVGAPSGSPSGGTLTPNQQKALEVLRGLGP
ncbi:MAG TPA: hypothetical protein VFF65_12815 [Phycisphaerales bacterium]|nr:hypothetical protein [Phycisphaerales bacterium]